MDTFGSLGFRIMAQRGALLWLIVLLLACQPAMAGQKVLLMRGLMDYLPGISPMRSLQARLTSEGYDVTMITHLTDGFYKNAYWDAVIGHSQGAIMGSLDPTALNPMALGLRQFPRAAWSRPAVAAENCVPGNR